MSEQNPAVAGDGARGTGYLVPAISHVLFLVVFLHLSFNVGNGLLKDGDTGYHIRAGELIIESLSVPHQDSFSFHSPPLAWTAHEWLSEVIMALVHRSFGLTGTVLFFIFMIAFIYAVLFRILRSHNRDFFVDIIVIVLVIISSQIHWLARPHIFSLLILVAWYFLLDAYQYGDRNRLYYLPPMMLLWVNLHGGFVIGFVLLGIYFAGNIFKYLMAPATDKERFKSKAVVLGITSLVCLVVSIINPYGYHILSFPFKLTSQKYLMDHVSEFLSPNFHGPVYFKYLLLLMTAFFAFSRTPSDIFEVALTILFIGMSLYSQRYIPLFAIIATPILSRQGSHLLEQARGSALNLVKKRSANLSAIDASAKGFLWPVAAVLLVVAFAADGRIQFRFDEKEKPVAAVEFLKKTYVPGHMFNNDEFGDYVIYSAYPQYKVFFDGRSDMYGTDRLKEYFTVMAFGSDMEMILRKYDIDWFFIETGSALSRYLIVKRDWQLVYSDSVASIFVRDIARNADVINKHGNVSLFVDKDKVSGRADPEAAQAPIVHR